jgi:hypothetical protein
MAKIQSVDFCDKHNIIHRTKDPASIKNNMSISTNNCQSYDLNFFQKPLILGVISVINISGDNTIIRGKT